MTAPLSYDVQGDLARIVLGDGRGNLPDRAARAALLDALDRADADPAVRAVVLAGAGGEFFSDTGLDAPDEVHEAPSLDVLCARLERMSKPVVAALAGAATGSGLELALAAHARVGGPRLSAALPGVAVGLPPAAGATQRLPRLVGAGAALDMLLTGRAVGAAEAVEKGLVDAVDEDPKGIAAALALELAAAPPVPASEREEGLADPARFIADVKAARADLTPAAPEVVHRLIECVEAALILPSEAGREVERTARTDCEDSDAAHALRHAALCEREAGRTEGEAARIHHVAVVGEAGAALAAECLAAGLEVTLVGLERAALDEALVDLFDALEAEIAAGRMTEDQRDDRLGLLEPTTRLEYVGEADVVIEGGENDPRLKTELLRAIGVAARPEAVIMSDAGLDPAALLAEAAGDAARFVAIDLSDGLPGIAGMCGAPGATAGTLATATALLRRLGRLPVRCGEAPGQVRAVLVSALARAVERLLLAGAGPDVIDAACRADGWAEGPCVLLDKLGLDRVSSEALTVEAHGWGVGGVWPLADLAAAGLTGRAAGRGLYAWRGDAPVKPAPEAAEIGEGAQPPAAAEIVRRIDAALAAAGGALVAGGGAAGVVDVDLAALHGLGFPRAKGGPMMAADLRGLLMLRRTLRTLRDEDAALWAEPAILAELIKNGRRFTDRPG